MSGNLALLINGLPVLWVKPSKLNLSIPSEYGKIRSRKIQIRTLYQAVDAIDFDVNSFTSVSVIKIALYKALLRICLIIKMRQNLLLSFQIHVIIKFSSTWKGINSLVTWPQMFRDKHRDRRCRYFLRCYTENLFKSAASYILKNRRKYKLQTIWLTRLLWGKCLIFILLRGA